MLANNISVAGDAHPFYRGSVVKALLSGKKVADEIVALGSTKLKLAKTSKLNAYVQKCNQIKDKKNQYLLSVKISNSVCVKVRQGHFFKIDWYSSTKANETIALTPVRIGHSSIDFVIHMNGASKSQFAREVKRGDKILCIGPLGSEQNLISDSLKCTNNAVNLQCMMKGMCGQCYQLKEDGTIEYACKKASNYNYRLAHRHINKLQETILEGRSRL